jgi:hypothetical protein
MQKKILAVILGLAFLASVTARAQSFPPINGAAMKMPASPASFCGTVVKLTERGCIGVKSAAGQPTYEITSATPKPIVGMLIAGSGTAAGASVCMHGAHLSNITWQRAQACPQ